jgi:hypothetical protein
MTHQRSRSLTGAATGLAAGLLLVGCSSSATTHANTPTTRATNAGATSSSPTAATSTTATPVGGSSPAALAGTSACVLVNEQEAGAALGADPGAGQAVTSHGASSCMYGTSPRILTVNLVPTGGKAAYDHLHATSGQLVDISGVGDAAFGTFHGPAAGIDFYKGDTFVAVVLVTGQASAPPKDLAIALAKTAASRI